MKIMEEKLREWLETYQEMAKQMNHDIELLNHSGLVEPATFMSGRLRQTKYVITKLEELLKVQ